MTLRYKVNADLTAREIADLREAVGWDRREAQYRQLLGRTYLRVTCYDGEQLVGYCDVLSDGVEDAFIRDMMVHPGYQRRGIGSEILRLALARIRDDGIRSVGVLFRVELAAFYRKVGFQIVGGGVIDNENPER